MYIGLLFRTVRHLKMTQVVHQLIYRLHKPKYVEIEAPVAGERPAGFKTEPIARWKCWEQEQSQYCFLNISAPFTTWNDTSHGMLWAYNLNYMDWLNQKGISREDCCYWIDKFIEDVCKKEEGKGKMFVGLDPAPIALRSNNWVKVFTRWPDSATKERKDALYSQLRLLERKLEYHLLANHLLEDAFALYIGAVYFGEEQLYKKASRLLKEQLNEQILPDGAHYEQSPMYHCIMLDRLLDCVNIGRVNDTWLRDYAVRMLGYLERVIWKDGSIPLLNDSAYGIAPMAGQLFDYAKRLGLKWEAIPMQACGYRKLQNASMEAIVDVGNITATYQPGHTHADTFNYELRIEGKPFVVDTGISTYNKTERRQYERGTKAHNCVVPVGCGDSSEVWGGFRVGKRATVSDVRCNMSEGREIVDASHDGFGKECRRKFEMTESAFVVEDMYDGEAVSYLHLAEGADLGRVKVEGVTEIEFKEEKYSTEYNRFTPCKVMEIHFNGKVKVIIS